MLKEIATLKKQKLDIEESFLNRSVELTKIKENLNKHHLEAHDTINQFSKVESQVCSFPNYI